MRLLVPSAGSDARCKGVLGGGRVAILVPIVPLLFALTSHAMAQESCVERIAVWNFQLSEDRNLDRKPDHWQRVRDRAHPYFIEMQIEPRDRESAESALEAQNTLAKMLHAIQHRRWNPSYIPESPPRDLADFFDQHVVDRCLEIQMDGSAAELISPLIPLDNRYNYSLSADMSSTKLHGHTAVVEFQLLDPDLRPLKVLRTSEIEGDMEWRKYATEVASTPELELKWGRVHLKVAPREGTHARGVARFDSIVAYRMPRLTLSTALPYHIASPSVAFKVDCGLMGLRRQQTSLTCELRDRDNNLVKRELVPIDRIHSSVPEFSSPTLADTPGSVVYTSKSSAAPPIEGKAVWDLQIDTPGLYRVRAHLGTSEPCEQCELLIGVMTPSEITGAGPFGWSVRSLGPHLYKYDLGAYARAFGAGWLKLPLTLDNAASASFTRQLDLISGLRESGVECVGILEAASTQPMGTSDPGDQSIDAATFLREPERWQPLLEPGLTRLGTRLKWLQLGQDGDASFANQAAALGALPDLRSRLQTSMQDMKLAIQWPWVDPPPSSTLPPWNALHMTSSPALTVAEMPTYLENHPHLRETWVAIDPLDGQTYALRDRVRDLVVRMIWIKKFEIGAAFVSDPFNSHRGLFTSQGTIGEMLLPWRSLVSAIGNSRYIGSLHLPHGSDNHVFENGEQGVMLLWNDSPGVEQFYYGSAARAVDVWGRPVDMPRIDERNGEQALLVDEWPLIVYGIDLEMVRLEQSFKLELENLASRPGVSQTLPISLENASNQALQGSVSCATKQLHEPMPSRSFQIPSRQRAALELPIVIRANAPAGKHQLRFDLAFSADLPKRLSVYRELTLGSGEVEFSWEASRQDAQFVDLRVELNNLSDQPVSFDCKLFPKGQPYQRFKVLGAAAGRTVTEIRLPLAAESSQTVWIRCEQLEADRVLNYQIEI